MPRRKKKANELTTDEALRRLFPTPVRKELKKLASEPRKSQKRKQNN